MKLHSCRVVRRSRDYIYCASVIVVLALNASCAGPRDDSDAESGTISAEPKGSDSGSTNPRVNAELPNVDTLRRDPTGAILSVTGANLSVDLESNASYAELARKGSRGDQAIYFLDFYRDAFRLSDSRVEFVADSVQQDDLGYAQVRLSQRIDSLPVRNAQVVVQFSPEEAITLVQGRYLVGALQYSLRPTIESKQAEQTVISEVGQTADLEYSGMAVLLHSTGDSNLVHDFFVIISTMDKDIVSVDAHSNRIVSKVPVVLTK